MLQQLPLLFRLQFVIERNHRGAAIEQRVGGDQPLGLIRHDDGDAVSCRDAQILQAFGQGKRAVLEIAIGEAQLFFAAVGFDQADFRRESFQRVAQRFANR